jgi:hypothetical protein
MESVFISIDCDEPNQETYRAVCVGDIRFETGDFLIDWINHLKYLGSLEFNFVIHSSSVNHFLMDGSKYYEVGIRNEYGKYNIVTRDEYLNGDYDFTAILLYDMTSFQEVREYYKQWEDEIN